MVIHYLYIFTFTAVCSKIIISPQIILLSVNGSFSLTKKVWFVLHYTKNIFILFDLLMKLNSPDLRYFDKQHNILPVDMHLIRDVLYLLFSPVFCMMLYSMCTTVTSGGLTQWIVLSVMYLRHHYPDRRGLSYQCLILNMRQKSIKASGLV